MHALIGFPTIIVAVEVTPQFEVNVQKFNLDPI